MKTVLEDFFASYKKFPQHPALDVNNQIFTYAQLAAHTTEISDIIKSLHIPSSFVGLLAHRSLTAYSGILGTLAAGKAIVPLNPKFPAKRDIEILNLASAQILIADKRCSAFLKETLAQIKRKMIVLIEPLCDIHKLTQQYPQHKFVEIPFRSDCAKINGESNINRESVAILLFTSGSTGIPKGVPLTHANLASYFDYMAHRYPFSENDRFSQVADLTFDISYHDVFLAWKSGACLCIVPEAEILAPAQFIKDKNITVWFSVPSVASFMRRMHMLTPDAFVSLRFSFFAGEPISGSLMHSWQIAAPHSIVENLYGPAEATITVTHYRWDTIQSPSECHNDMVPMGTFFPHVQACIINDDKKIISTEEPGELCLSGPQVVAGYFEDARNTKEKFIKIQEFGDRLWYKTGDLVKRDKKGIYHFIDRADNMVKVLGCRVELQEVDTVLRRLAQTEMAVSVAWPAENRVAQGIIGFIAAPNTGNANELIKECKKLLPEYMIPRKIFFIDELPLNNNGKIDRKKLFEDLENKKYE